MSDTSENQTSAPLDEEILARRDAALAQVIQFGDPVLRSRASEVREFGQPLHAEVEWLSDDVVLAEEGCLSIPRISVDVERPLFLKVSGADVGGDPVTIEASGLEARVLQHEVDHLDGVLILDRTAREQRKGALKALREGGTYSPGEAEAEAAAEAGDGAVEARPAATEA